MIHDLEYAPTILCLNNHETILHSKSGSDLSLDKKSLRGADNESNETSNGSTIKFNKCSDDDINLIETSETSSNLHENFCKNAEINTKLDNLENVEGLDKNFTTGEHEQTNIEECLLDLDDYLERIDENCLIDTANLNFNISTVPDKSIPPFECTQSASKSTLYSPFERRSNSRSTTGGSLHKPKTVPEREASSIYGTWSEKNRSNANISSVATHFDTETEAPHCSTSINNFESLENTPNLELLFNRGNDKISQNVIDKEVNNETDTPEHVPDSGALTSTLNNTTQELTHSHYDSLRSTEEVPYHNESDGSTRRYSRNTTSSTTSGSSRTSAESLATSDTLEERNINVNQDGERHSVEPNDIEIINPTLKSGFNTYWPHGSSRTFALISCTLGMFNIIRFATLTINYGGNFLIQFGILSIIFGIPFLWLQMSLGARIEEGPISMWKISPVCFGIGISITLVQCLITIYSSVAIVWLIKFIQDILHNKLSNVWTPPILPKLDRQSFYEYSNLTENIPDYFDFNISQRKQILKTSDEQRLELQLNDPHLALYLTLLWIAVYVVLCKGLKSFGKCILLLGVLPNVCLALFAVKLLCVVDLVKLQNVFGSFQLDEFLVNSKTWTAAAQEAFLTWGLFGASVIAISSRSQKNSTKFALRKDAILVVLVTLLGLCLSAVVGLCSIQILNESGYVYVPGSYEFPKNQSAVYSLKSSQRQVNIYPTKFVPHYSTLVGEVYRSHMDTTNVSGYQVLRFITELLPAVVAVSTENLSWLWTSLIFIAFFGYGFSQLCVMWQPVSLVLGNSSRAVLITCCTGLLLSIPFVTVRRIRLVYFMDILLGGAWFIPILWTTAIFGVFLIRGRPYNGDDLVNVLKMSVSMSAFLALSWNILLPIGLVTLAIIEYKISMTSQFYRWHSKSYFDYWSRKIGALTQIGFLMLVPVTAVVQTYRYLSSGPPDVLDRIKMLYRPSYDVENNPRNGRTNRNGTSGYNESYRNCAMDRLQNDAPPKYTPPPSFATATGSKIAKIFRQSFKRSMRRVLRESERRRPMLCTIHGTQNEQMTDAVDNPRSASTSEETSISISECIELENKPLNLLYGRSLSLGRKEVLNKSRLRETIESAPPVPAHRGGDFNRSSLRKLYNYTYGADDVLKILRSTAIGRRGISRSVNLKTESTFGSVENIVQNDEASNSEAAVIEKCSNHEEHVLTSMI